MTNRFIFTNCGSNAKYEMRVHGYKNQLTCFSEACTPSHC
uniref:Uncharacterized protein n=1 Tax=Klebsiella pneumoniae TaxID=573 RepID=A0A8B0SWM4_KLEPN|nr:hypothetical protein [Klebsiella pneumoniae]